MGARTRGNRFVTEPTRRLEECEFLIQLEKVCGVCAEITMRGKRVKLLTAGQSGNHHIVDRLCSLHDDQVGSDCIAMGRE